MKRPGVISRYAHDKFSDWSYPVRRADGGTGGCGKGTRLKQRGARGMRPYGENAATQAHADWILTRATPRRCNAACGRRPCWGP
jgi:hypothetical protein